MSAHERLDEIQARIDFVVAHPAANGFTRTAYRTDLPATVAALRAVLALHTQYPGSHERPSGPLCRCMESMPCTTVRAIDEALGGDPR